MRSPSQHPYTGAWQKVRNEHWPPDPRSLKRRERIPVYVRIVWASDGEEWIEGAAHRWDDGHVFVEVPDDPRLPGVQGVWVVPADVRRRYVSAWPR